LAAYRGWPCWDAGGSTSDTRRKFIRNALPPSGAFAF
jgi:hypothetical protein